MVRLAAMPEKVLQSGRLLVALLGRCGATARALRARATKHCRRRDGFSEASRDTRNAKTDPIRGVVAVNRALLTELRSATAFASRTAVRRSDRAPKMGCGPGTLLRSATRRGRRPRRSGDVLFRLSRGQNGHPRRRCQPHRRQHGQSHAAVQSGARADGASGVPPGPPPTALSRWPARAADSPEPTPCPLVAFFARPHWRGFRSTSRRAGSGSDSPDADGARRSRVQFIGGLYRLGISILT